MYLWLLARMPNFSYRNSVCIFVHYFNIHEQIIVLVIVIVTFVVIIVTVPAAILSWYVWKSVKTLIEL